MPAGARAQIASFAGISYQSRVYCWGVAMNRGHGVGISFKAYRTFFSRAILGILFLAAQPPLAIAQDGEIGGQFQARSAPAVLFLRLRIRATS